MYEIVKSVILNQRYELSSMLRKIDTLWVQDSLNDEQKSELVSLAREKADPAMSIDIMGRLDDIDARVRKLESKNPGGGEVDPGVDPEYPEFQPNHVYMKGDKVTFEGKKYECVLNEYTDKTTWSPGDYPAYWREVVIV